MVSWLFLDIKNTLHVHVHTLSQISRISRILMSEYLLSYCRIGLIFLFFLYPLGSSIYQLLTFLSCETEQQLPTELKLKCNFIWSWGRLGF